MLFKIIIFYLFPFLNSFYFIFDFFRYARASVRTGSYAPATTLNIRVAHKPITTLRQLLTNVKDKDEPSDR